VSCPSLQLAFDAVKTERDSTTELACWGMIAEQLTDGINNSLMAFMSYVSESSSNCKATCQLGSAIRCVRMQAEPMNRCGRGRLGGLRQLRPEQPQYSCLHYTFKQVRKHFGAFPRQAACSVLPTEFRSYLSVYASPLQAFVMIPHAQGSSYRQIMVVAVAMSVFSRRITLTGRELY